MSAVIPPTPTTETVRVAKIERFGFDNPMDLNEMADMAFGPILEPGQEQTPLRDAREDFHMECDCVPDLGPSHCHACGENEDSVVTWWRALELHESLAVSS